MRENFQLNTQELSEPEKAVLVAVQPWEQTEETTAEYLDELAFLAETANIATKNFFIQNLDHPDFKTYVGKGKLQEIADFMESYEIETIIFDDDLSPAQVRNLSSILKGKRIIDRSLLILEIFALRAQSHQSRLQVELAQYQYIYPRLTRMWTHLSRQRGGAPGQRGAGEKELETDRRLVRDRISLLKKKLEKVEKQAETRRKSRQAMVKAVLAGYTNVGKSTLMNQLTKSNVFAENKLFATVDSTVRRIALNGIPFLLTDTVGFIRKLPTHLVESFKSTLDEIREAQVIIHVVDGSHSFAKEQYKVVQNILKDLNSHNKPTILVINKIDQLNEEQEMELRMEFGGLNGNVFPVFCSAQSKENIDTFRDLLSEEVKKIYQEIYPNHLNPEGYYTVN